MIKKFEALPDQCIPGHMPPFHEKCCRPYLTDHPLFKTFLNNNVSAAKLLVPYLKESPVAEVYKKLKSINKTGLINDIEIRRNILIETLKQACIKLHEQP